MSGSALPPDVRRWLRPADNSQMNWGYALGTGLALQIYWANGRTKGIAQNIKGTLTAGQSHRLTSGGKAESALGGDF